MEFYKFRGSRKFNVIPFNIFELQLIGQNYTMAVIYYLSDEKEPMAITEFQQSPVPAYIEVLWNFQEDTMAVISLNVHPDYQGKGFGSFLMILASTEAEKVGLRKISLDDDSDLYRHPNNIYLRLGLEYVTDDGPEMVGLTRTVADKWSLFRRKYIR